MRTSFLSLCTVVFFFQACPLSCCSLEHLKQREKVLMEQWRQQQPNLLKVLSHLKGQATYSPIFRILLARNLADWVHQNLLLQAVTPTLNKQQHVIVKLYRDIKTVRHQLKELPAYAEPYAPKNPS